MEMIKHSIIILLFNIFGMHFIQARDIDLLTKNYTIDDVREYLTKDNNWVAYPDYADRTGWKQLTAPFYEQLLKEGKQPIIWNTNGLARVSLWRNHSTRISKHSWA
jgi:hypothetical protein